MAAIRASLKEIRYERDALLRAATKPGVDPETFRKAAVKDATLERRKIVSCTEFMLKEGRLAEALESRDFLRSRLEKTDKALAEMRVTERPTLACALTSSDLTVCECCAVVAEVFVREGRAPALAKATTFLAKARTSQTHAPLDFEVPPCNQEVFATPGHTTRVERAAVIETLAAQARGLEALVKALSE